MRRPRIFTGDELGEGRLVQLRGQAAHYVSRVLRRGPGDELYLFNGLGGEYEARITGTGRDSVEVEVLAHHPEDFESPLHTRLGLVVSRGDRMDRAVQKATELGVSSLTPLLSEHCEVRLPRERGLKKRQHWQQIAVSACEQCGRNRVPEIGEVQALASWLGGDSADLNLVFAAGGKAMDCWRCESPQSLRLLVGPEGGLSATELKLAGTAGFITTSLGPRVLRTETAPMAALAVAQVLWGDF